MIYGYGRVSTKGQAKDGNSLEAQERLLKEHGAEIIYMDSFTGTKMTRPEFDKLLKKLKAETLEEEALNRSVMEAIHRITRNDGDFAGAFRQNVIRVIGSYGKEQEPDEYEDKIKTKQQKMVALIAENAKTGSYTQEFDERYRSIAEEIEILKKEQADARKKKRLAESYEQRIQDMDAFIKRSTCQIPEFENDLVRRLISSIKVVSAEKLIIQFQSGIVMEQEIRYD